MTKQERATRTRQALIRSAAAVFEQHRAVLGVWAEARSAAGGAQ